MKRWRFIGDERGMGAIEFAILAPILILMITGIVVGAGYASQLLDTRAAVQAGAKYVLQGGSDNTTIRSVSLAAWANKPTGGDIQVVRYCVCGVTINSCSALCVSTQRAPPAFIEIEATAAWASPLQNSWLPSGTDVIQTQVVRVR